MKCVTCNCETENPKFCSRSCSAKFNNTLAPKRKLKPRFCKACNVDLKRKNCSDNRMVCKNCHGRTPTDIVKAMTLEEFYQDIKHRGKHTSWVSSYLRDFGRSWNKDMQRDSCVNCGYNKHTNMCHIKPVASFPMTATLGEVNDKSNIVILCPNCHWEFDNGLLNLKICYD